MRNLIKKMLRKKNNGQSDLICSLIVITALIAILFLSISVIQDINKVIQIDQIARQSIIKLETTNKLTNTQINSIKASLTNVGVEFDGTATVNGSTINDGVYVMYKNSSGKWVVDTSNNHSFNYGDEVAVYIQCEIYTTKFGGNIFGNGALTKGKKQQVKRIKSSITKAST